MPVNPVIVHFDEYISEVASAGGNPATTLAEIRLLLEVRSRIIALEKAGRELLAIADQVNDVTLAGQPAQSDELVDRLFTLDTIVSGAPAPEHGRPTQPMSRAEPVEFIARRRDGMARRA